MNAAEITLSPADQAPAGVGGIVPAEALRLGTGRTRRFVGRENGAGISYFFVDYEPGEGPGLHWHPYTETWVVLDGTAEITIGDRRVIARTGDTVTGPAGVWHRFENAGEERLRVLCIHASDVIIQTWADDE